MKNEPYYLDNYQKVIIFALSFKTKCTMFDDQEELKARIEAAEQDLSFFSLNWDAIRESGWLSEEEPEESINETLDDLIEAKNKLKERGGSP